MASMSLIELHEDTVRSMSIGAVFSDFGGKINSVDFHRKEDLLVTASVDDSIRLYDIASAKLLKTTYHRKHGTDRICFTHHPSSVIYSSKNNLDSTGESLRYLSMYDNRCTSKGIKRVSGYVIATSGHRLAPPTFRVLAPPLHKLNALIGSAVVGAVVGAGTRNWWHVVSLAGLVTFCSAAADFSKTF